MNLPTKVTSPENNKQTSSHTGINLNNRKIQFFLVPTRTMERNKLMSKSFKQTFQITDIKHNIIGIPFITKYLPTIIILNSRTHIEINTRD